MTLSAESLSSALTFPNADRQVDQTEVMDGLKKLAYLVRTLWLFTKSDMPTSTIINTTFAVLGIFSESTLITNTNIGWAAMIRGILVAFYFTWHLTLCFNLANQRQPRSIIEDGINKPWRPIPASRISPESAFVWYLASVSSLLILCITTLGATRETTFYLFCAWLYNECGWSDKTWWQRAILNACGITANRVATLRVATAAAKLGEHFQFTNQGLGWFFILAIVTFTTIQIQDLRDQKGDAKIDRQTLPLILGDPPSRWLTTFAVWVWSIACPRFWDLGTFGSVMPILVATGVTAHITLYRTRQDDQTSFRLVAVWWISLYSLPMMSARGL